MTRKIKVGFFPISATIDPVTGNAYIPIAFRGVVNEFHVCVWLAAVRVMITRVSAVIAPEGSGGFGSPLQVAESERVASRLASRCASG